jgi:hypothetical protein
MLLHRSFCVMCGFANGKRHGRYFEVVRNGIIHVRFVAAENLFVSDSGRDGYQQESHQQ